MVSDGKPERKFWDISYNVAICGPVFRNGDMKKAPLW
jgi:hypothetical protein